MLALIELGFKELLATAVALLGIASAAALVVGHFIRGVRRERGSVKDEVIDGLQKLGELHKTKITQLTEGLDACRGEHEACERKVNAITAFNLRLQARLTRQEGKINRLERQLEIEETDFSKEADAQEDPDFR